MKTSEQLKKLSEELTSGTCDCAVCLDRIRYDQPLWSCRKCYAVFHGHCIVHWAQTRRRERMVQLQTTSTAGEFNWDQHFPCPLCQGSNEIATTTVYTCYCGKMVHPRADLSLVPGSCGQPCEKRRADPNCPHRCALLCHPGRCPPCTHSRQQACYCGKHKSSVGCSSEVYGFECGETCGKTRDCGIHTCTSTCHDGPCPVCTSMQTATCFCGEVSRSQRCGEPTQFRCSHRCRKLRDCGQHECGQLCHDGPCQPCLRTPERQHLCPCGKQELLLLNAPPRVTCLDPVATCGETCDQPLPCGHSCWFKCHDSTSCSPCMMLLEATCGCGSRRMRFPCFCQYLPQVEWPVAAERAGLPPETVPSSLPVKCGKPCRKQLSCRKHRCNEVCCTSPDHLCYQICIRKLSCGVHKCGQLCHDGPCPPCREFSYERLYCRCRRSWVEPPVPCGTVPPNCNHPCVVPRPCGHPANHPCHIEPECPECVVPVAKLCASHRQPMPYFMPCYQTNVSCGKKCGKLLSCCGKQCSKVCHGGTCQHKCNHAFPSFSEMPSKR